MSQSLTRLYVHAVFSTKHRQQLIDDSWRPKLHAYLHEILEQRKCELIAAGGIEDHMHLLIQMKPTVCVSDLIRDLKNNSSSWRHHLGDAQFWWQNGYGCFSVSSTQLKAVKKYIANQREHHKEVTFQIEYLDMLDRAGLEYDEKHIWE